MDEALDGAAGVHLDDWYTCVTPAYKIACQSNPLLKASTEEQHSAQAMRLDAHFGYGQRHSGEQVSREMCLCCIARSMGLTGLAVNQQPDLTANLQAPQQVAHLLLCTPMHCKPNRSQSPAVRKSSDTNDRPNQGSVPGLLPDQMPFCAIILCILLHDMSDSARSVVRAMWDLPPFGQCHLAILPQMLTLHSPAAVRQAA